MHYERDFEPIQCLNSIPEQTSTLTKMHSVELVVFCGSPASGKSTFFWRQLQPQGYIRVNQDILKTRDKCVKVAAQALENEQSVAVDNTNADEATRAVWIKLGQQYDVPVRCVHFTASTKLCEHNDHVRALATSIARSDESSLGSFNPEKRDILPHSAFAHFRSRFEPPRSSEGFWDLSSVDFCFLGDEQARQLWSQYWI